MDKTFEYILGQVLDFFWIKTEATETFASSTSTMFVFIPKYKGEEFRWVDIYGLSIGFQTAVIEAFKRIGISI